MLKLFVLTALVAFAAANSIDHFVGEWRVIKVFAKDAVAQECEPLQITDLKQYCTCGSDEKVSKAKLTVGTKYIIWPAYYVNSFNEATNSLKTECTCEGNKVGHFVFYRLTDNYFLLMFTDPGLEFTALVAKSVPSEAEVDEYIKTIEYFKDKTSHFVCSSEILHSNESKHTTGKHWWQHEKSKF